MGDLEDSGFSVLVVFVYDVANDQTYWMQHGTSKGQNPCSFKDSPKSLTLLSVLWEQVAEGEAY